jgi:hypothetical protein
MRSSSRRLAVTIGATLALALVGNAPSFAAPKHTMRHEPPAQAAHARAAPQDRSDVADPAATMSLPGYSARPPGMCWEQGGGGGSDLAGFWKHCDSGRTR